MEAELNLVKTSHVDVRGGTHWSWLAVLAGCILAYLWFVLAKQLSAEWSINLQYAYGWYVPPFCVLLVWRRWKNRPAPKSPRHVTAAVLVMVFCALLLLPVRLLFEVAAELRVLHWALAASVVGITLCGVYFTGGRSWVRHFAFPVAFILVAVPWLLEFEQPFIQLLTRTVTKLTVVSLNIVGVAASRSGNVIQTVSGPVGVDEACSGVRSFQGTLMISLFLGELLNLQWRRRFMLVGISVTIAFGLNLVRAFFLSWNAAMFGLGAIARWHDRAGNSIFWITFLLMWGIAEWMRSPHAGNVSRQAKDNLHRTFPLPRLLVIALACWLTFVTVGVELWYRLADRHKDLAWTVSLPPPDASNFEPLTLPEAVSQKLQHDRQVTGSWTDGNGADWHLFFFRWERGPVYSRIMARFHRPEACFPAGGNVLIADHGIRVFTCGVLELPFRAYEFSINGQLLRVFYCTADDQVRAGPPDDSREWETSLDTRIGERSRLRKIVSVWRGGRKMAQQTLEIMVAGYPTQEAADAALARNLPNLIRLSDSEPASAK